MISGFGYDGPKPKACGSRANDIAEAVLLLIEAKTELDKAITNCPSYTGQWSREDYWANALEGYYRAADALEEAIDG